MTLAASCSDVEVDLINKTILMDKLAIFIFHSIIRKWIIGNVGFNDASILSSNLYTPIIEAHFLLILIKESREQPLVISHICALVIDLNGTLPLVRMTNCKPLFVTSHALFFFSFFSSNWTLQGVDSLKIFSGIFKFENFHFQSLDAWI